MNLPDPSVNPVLVHSFGSQSRQFPTKGPAGLSHEIHHAGYSKAFPPHQRQVPIECVLHRNRHGDLTGILYYYPEDCYEVDGSQLEKAGNVNVYVRPDSHHQGIATQLIAFADSRWGIDFTQQRYTPAGRATAERYLRARRLLEEARVESNL